MWKILIICFSFQGQQVVEEILDSQRPGCPIEYFNIPVPNDHPFLQGKESLEMPFPRTRYDSSTGYSPNNPRQQVCVHTCKPMYLGSGTVNSLLLQYPVIRGLDRVISK